MANIQLRRAIESAFVDRKNPFCTEKIQPRPTDRSAQAGEMLEEIESAYRAGLFNNSVNSFFK